MSLYNDLCETYYEYGLSGQVVPVKELTILQWNGALTEGHHFQNGQLITGADAFSVLLLLQDAYLNGDLDDEEDGDDSWY